MGFQRKRKVYVLDFTGTDLDGLEVRARGVNIGQALEADELRQRFAEVQDDDDLAAKAVTAMVHQFAGVLVSWNLVDDDDQPVPATEDGLRELEIGELMQVIGAWRKAVAEVPAPLVQRSDGTEPSLEASLPMETSSASLAS